MYKNHPLVWAHRIDIKHSQQQLTRDKIDNEADRIQELLREMIVGTRK